MLERYFQLSKHGTNVRTEMLAGLTTFLTMAYIIFLQPAILEGTMLGAPTGMDFDAVMVATCLAAAVATAIMGLYARYPIAQAPGMGENFIFTLSVVPAAAGLAAVEAGTTEAWQVALGVVFIAGILFLVFSLFGLRRMILETISPSMRNAIAVGIGLFIAFIGLRTAGVVAASENGLKLNAQFGSPDLLIFFFGFILTATLHARGIRGAIVWGIVASTLLALLLQWGLPQMPAGIAESELVTKSHLMTRFQTEGAGQIVSAPPSIAPTFLKMDLICALSMKMIPFIFIFLFMDLFDTLGTLMGVSEQAGFFVNGKLPRAQQAMLSDAVGTSVGAALGTSTVTSFIESTAGVSQGGRTGLTALCTAGLFVAALFFSPLVRMVGSYSPITAPALVIVGSMMMTSVRRIEWSDATEAIPAFVTLIGIPLTDSIADGLALGFLAYPVIKFGAGRGREVPWLMYAMAAVLAAYFVFVRAQAG